MTSISNLVLPPLSVVYRAVTQARLAAYRRGLLPTTKLDAPVISVGNLTTGGTGKTPLAEWVARVLSRRKRKVCILTRGYGRTDPRTRVVVSDGTTVLVNAAEAGDEPYLLAQNLKGLAAVISDPDRIAAGKWAIEKLAVDAFVLDDGFQHLQLSRDLNILTIDATNPWGRGHLLPYGRLREPRSEASRADCVVLTKADQSDELAMLKEQIHRFSKARPMFVSRMKVRGLTSLASGLSQEIGSLPQPAAAFCAIGNPKSFFAGLRRAGIDLVLTRIFPDHHRYSPADVASLSRESKQLGAQSLITTAKDAVKLGGFGLDLPCYLLRIEISIEEDDKLIDMIHAAIER